MQEQKPETVVTLPKQTLDQGGYYYTYRITPHVASIVWRESTLLLHLPRSTIDVLRLFT